MRRVRPERETLLRSMSTRRIARVHICTANVAEVTPSRPVLFILVDPGSRLQLLGISKLSVEVNKSEILQYEISGKWDVQFTEANFFCIIQRSQVSDLALPNPDDGEINTSPGSAIPT
jgi:hypothetical protein